MNISTPIAFFKDTVQPALEQLGWGSDEFRVQDEPIYQDADGTVFACNVPSSSPLIVALLASHEDDHGRRWLGNIGYNARAPLAVGLSSNRALLIAPHMIRSGREAPPQPEFAFGSTVEDGIAAPHVVRQIDGSDLKQALFQLGITPLEVAQVALLGGIYSATGFHRRDPVDRALIDHLISVRQELLREEPVNGTSDEEYFRLDDCFLRLVGSLLFVRSLEDRKVLASLPVGSLLSLAHHSDLLAALRHLTEPIRRLYGTEVVPHVDYPWQSVGAIRRLIKLLYFDPSRKASFNFALLDEDILAILYQRYLQYLLTRRRERAQTRLLGREDREATYVRRKLGIYYTPRSVVDIVRAVIDAEMHGNRVAPSVLDPASGAAAFLRPMMLWMHSRWDQLSAEELAGQIVGLDEDPRAVTLAKQALARGLEKHTEGRIPELGIYRGDFLENAPDGSPAPAGQLWEQRFDVVVGNPPFLSHANLKKEDPERTRKLREDFSSVVGKETNLAAYFIFQALRVLRSGGLLGMVVPRVMLRGDNYEQLRKTLLRMAEVVAVVDFGVEQIFEDPSITTALLFLRRRATDLEQPATMKARSILTLRYREDYAPLIARALQGTARAAELDGVLLEASCHARPKGPWLLLSNSGERAEALLTTGDIKAESVLRMEYAVDIMAGNGKALLFDEVVGEEGPVAQVWSHKLKKNVLVERELLRPAILSRNIQRFRFGGGKAQTYVFYPYLPDGTPVREDEILGPDSKFPHAARLIAGLELVLRAVRGHPSGVWYGPRNIRPTAVWHNAKTRASFADTMLVRRREDRIPRVAPVRTDDGIPIGALLTFAVRREYTSNVERFLAFFNSSLMNWYLIMTVPEFGQGGYARTSLATFRPLRFPRTFFEADALPLASSLALLADVGSPTSPAQILRLEKEVDDWVYAAFGFDDLLRERIRSEVLGFTSNPAFKSALYRSAVARATINTSLEVGPEFEPTQFVDRAGSA